MSAGTVIFAVVVGLAVGCIVGALGAGGGILSVPILVYLLGQEPHDAAAGSLVIVGLTAIVSIIPHARAGRVRWRDGLIFAAMSIIGAVAGSRLSVLVPSSVLMLCFGALLVAVGVLMWRKAEAQLKGRAAQKPRDFGKYRLLALLGAATVTGFLTGFFGVGGGFAVVPMLVLVLAIPMREAVGTSLLVMIIASATGLASRLGTGVHVDWPVVLSFALASMAGGLIGAPASRKLKESTLTGAFAVLLLAVALATLIQTGVSLIHH
ncbi:MAG: sulfite exporter TauE/SafE family protein [Actinomycetaceae bacterium]|nr:sulfite exporter TauE/SafE family protein [Actinomycetaceae bacterium]MDU0970573.1 sulfite exporter TauE/SafE family protein [Actinomycetaceae bacterium]